MIIPSKIYIILFRLERERERENDGERERERISMNTMSGEFCALVEE